MSTPSACASKKIGVPQVASHATRTPRSCAAAQMAGMSHISIVNDAGVSTNMRLVVSRSRADMSASWSKYSTSVSDGISSVSQKTRVGPYTPALTRMWVPMPACAASTAVIAASPLLVAMDASVFAI
ncbi:hypothetical protein RM641_00885 [Streptomyces sp. DSM 41921]|uniref:Uncharacterized protein n=1 Tax=Streptomyces dubilierae TaxID=3075533 RepID=A0ABU2P2K7_9ACTN|nr:hypothetical protein [Streptomyces sp. DSM 41921]MDT0385983.1 hypothetical protein [Streptomyces sp. DSM 41921]